MLLFSVELFGMRTRTLFWKLGGSVFSTVLLLSSAVPVSNYFPLALLIIYSSVFYRSTGTCEIDLSFFTSLFNWSSSFTASPSDESLVSSVSRAFLLSLPGSPVASTAPWGLASGMSVNFWVLGVSVTLLKMIRFFFLLNSVSAMSYSLSSF